MARYHNEVAAEADLPMIDLDHSNRQVLANQRGLLTCNKRQRGTLSRPSVRV
jgi:hypothetical protein